MSFQAIENHKPSKAQSLPRGERRLGSFVSVADLSNSGGYVMK